MSKSITKIVKATLGLTMAIGAGVGAGLSGKRATMVNAADVITNYSLVYENNCPVNNSNKNYNGGLEEVTVNNVKWYGTNVNQNADADWRIGGNKSNGLSSAATRVVYTKTAISNVDKIRFEWGNVTIGLNSSKLTVHSTAAAAANGSNAVATFNGSDFLEASSKVDVDAPSTWSTVFIRMVFDCQANNTTTNKFVQLKNVSFYSEDTSSVLTGLRISSGEDIVEKNYDAGDLFDPSGLVVQAQWNGEWDTAHNVADEVVWSPKPLTALTTSVTGTFTAGGVPKTVTVSGLTVTAPDVVLDKDNTPFTSTSGSNTSEGDKTLDEIEYHNFAGYNYNDFLSFNRSQNGAYLANNDPFEKNIAKVVVKFNSGGSSLFTMYEGNSALSETYSVSPSANGTGKITYTFKDRYQFFKLKLTTTGTYANIESISIFFGRAHVDSVISGVIASVKEGTYYAGSTLSESDVNVRVTWTNDEPDTYPESGFVFTVNGVENGQLSSGDNTVSLVYQNVKSNDFVVVGTVIHVESVSIAEATASIEKGSTISLHGSVTPANAIESIVWSSSDNLIATVSDTGVVTGVSFGSATITATANGHTDTCEVTVSTTKTIVLTDANLLGYDGTNVAYSADLDESNVDGMSFAYTGCGAYGYGIQTRKNNDTGTSTICNTTKAELVKLVFEWESSKAVAAKTPHFIVEFSNEDDFSELVGEEIEVTVNDSTKLAEVAPTAPANYFRITHASGNTAYLESIKVVCETPHKYLISATPVANLTDDILRLGSSISQENWNSVASLGDITDYGVMVYKTDSESNIKSSTPVEDAYRAGEVQPAIARKGNGTAPNPVNGNCEFTVRMRVSNQDTIFCSASFMVVDGQYYFFNEQHVTARQLASI